jgi:hypothetical protein
VYLLFRDRFRVEFLSDEKASAALGGTLGILNEFVGSSCNRAELGRFLVTRKDEDIGSLIGEEKIGDRPVSLWN